MREEKEEIAECYPSPSFFYKELVKEVAFLGKIGGCCGGRVRLCRCIVGGMPCRGVEERKYGAYEKGRRIYG